MQTFVESRLFTCLVQEYLNDDDYAGLQGSHGRIVNVPSVAAIRDKTGLSQPKFAQLLGVSVRTLQEWEQGRRAPSGAARTLLLIAARNPHVLLEVA